MARSPLTGPKVLHERVEGLGAPLRVEALVTCAYCRESHGGMCVGELTADESACPVDALQVEVKLRKLERPDSD